jgi:hypothetical protein
MGTTGQDHALPHWKVLYEAALLETNPENSLKLVTDAERAILDRIAAISASAEHAAMVESAALWRSLNVLRDLRKMVDSAPTERL